MSFQLRRRSIALALAALAFAAGAACAPRAGSDPAPDHRSTTTEDASVSTDSAGCGAGGDGGRGGDGGDSGRPGEPGEPGTDECTEYSDLPDKAKADLSVADKVRVVLVLINDGATEAQIADKYHMPKSEVEAWRKAYLERDWSVLTGK
ncbi:helix-turn-helix domain-containing protein [Streptomyces sp. NPDC047706]|uniref:helix-turn-helix domain-containing protein n=1 Tax=Streptomyces sp. NPDC047706 TaxID=3365486 RepID=UPI00371C2491